MLASTALAAARELLLLHPNLASKSGCVDTDPKSPSPSHKPTMQSVASKHSLKHFPNQCSNQPGIQADRYIIRVHIPNSGGNNT